MHISDNNLTSRTREFYKIIACTVILPRHNAGIYFFFAVPSLDIRTEKEKWTGNFSPSQVSLKNWCSRLRLGYLCRTHSVTRSSIFTSGESLVSYKESTAQIVFLSPTPFSNQIFCYDFHLFFCLPRGFGRFIFCISLTSYTGITMTIDCIRQRIEDIDCTFMYKQENLWIDMYKPCFVTFNLANKGYI